MTTIKKLIKFCLNGDYRMYLLKWLANETEGIIDAVISRGEQAKKNELVRINQDKIGQFNQVEEYWGEHTVTARPFKSALMSRRNLAWRFSWYPKFRELMDLFGEHKNETIVDYGCGPGNDIVGFGLYSKAKKIIGIDISLKALQIAQQRIFLHNEIDSQRIELIKISDKMTKIPLKSQSIDYIYCEGVLHHTTNPLGILKEFYRILKPGAFVSIMVYNYESIFVHLYLAYEIMIVDQQYSGLNLAQVFCKSTDGEQCPISRYYESKEFLNLASQAKFTGQYLGGYLLKPELTCLKKYLTQALKDERLAKSHQTFLTNLTFDQDNLPLYQGKYAGIGGVYQLCRLSASKRT